jgi:hypothetical protein
MMTSMDARYKGGEALEARRITSNIPFILGSLVMLLVVGLVGFLQELDETESRSAVAVNVGYDRAVKPIMYQFDVVSQDPFPVELSGSTRKIPYIWNHVWESAGWTPVKLMVEEYAARPEYKEVIDLLVNVNVLQRRHVYKYLAMSAAGGGWLAHSDTFPLHPFGAHLTLPNEGRLSVYDFKYPCLMSGNATEWLRMGKRIAEHAKVYHLRDQWTEALALQQMQMDYVLQNGQVYELPNNSSDFQWTWNSQICQETRHKRAIHFRLGEKEDLSSLSDPGDMVIKWLSMWLQSCERSQEFVTTQGGRRTQTNTATDDSKDGTIIQVGSYHAPADYEQDDVTSPPEVVEVTEAPLLTEGPPIKAGSYHAPEDYAGSSSEQTGGDDQGSNTRRHARLRALALAMGGGGI